MASQLLSFQINIRSSYSSVQLLVHNLQIRELGEVGCQGKKRQAPSNLQVGMSALCTYKKLLEILKNKVILI